MIYTAFTLGGFLVGFVLAIFITQWLRKAPEIANERPMTEIKLLPPPFPRHRTPIKLADYRGNAALVKQGRQLLEQNGIVIDVLNNEHPGWEVLPPGVPDFVRASHQAKCEGYTMCLANIEALGTLQEPEKELIPTFESDTENTEN